MDKSFDNRTLSCLVTYPPGRPICQFQSIKEFLEAFRDIIRAHKSLYQDGSILHRDISENNLIITDAREDGEPKGMIIDLDLAKELRIARTGARRRTGTIQFMAIEVLEGEAHTYRHDLESLFYVFLWVIIHSGLGPNKGLPSSSPLRYWYSGTYLQIAAMKKSHMEKTTFETILDWFPPQFRGLQPLARELRQILFPIRNESVFRGTYHDSNMLYQPMLDEFNSAIAKQTAAGLG